MPPRSPYDDLADRLKEMCRREARQVSPAVERWKVVATSPLTVENEDGVRLEYGDPDVEFDRDLIAGTIIGHVNDPEGQWDVIMDGPAVGDTVSVHHDGQDWIVEAAVL